MIDENPGRSRNETSSDRMLSVIDLFSPERPEWTVEEACAVLGQSESTVYRHFRTLTSAGLIFSYWPGRYLLGPGIAHYDRQLRLSDPLLRTAESALTELATEFSGPGSLFVSRLFRDHVMTMHEHRIGAGLAEGVFARGRLAPLFGGAPAFAIVSFLEVRAVRAMHRRSGADADGWLEIKRRMRAVRAQRYALGVDEPDTGVTHVSVPLLQVDGGVIGSLSLASPSGMHDAAETDDIVGALTRASEAIASRIGGDAVR
ncbi:IclR family transcriptional regulator [Microbacterium sp. NPDC091313]